MVLLYDYLHGMDFAEEALQTRSAMGILTKKNVDAYLQKFGSGHWDAVDFTKFSKKLNPALKQYNFGIDAILAQF